MRKENCTRNNWNNCR